MLKEGYIKTIEAANKPITERYIAELVRFKSNAMQEGKFSDALAIDNEIIALKKNGAKTEDGAKTVRDQYVGLWAQGKEVILLSADGTTACIYGVTGKWVVTDKLLTITWSNGCYHEYRIAKLDNKDKLDGNDFNPDGSNRGEKHYDRVRMP